VKNTKMYKKDPKTFTFFCGEAVYTDALREYGEVVIYDIENSWYPIRSSEIRKDPYIYWDYILGAARSFFAKRVLITGTESTGKTSLTKMLAKLYHTSWSYEVGRYYCDEYMGSNEDIYNDTDFKRLAHLQYEKDEAALRNSNRVCFFDTDAVVTQYYSELYLGHKLDYIENFARPERYDIVLMLKPDIPWVDDGKRLNGDQERRWKLHEHLKNMYLERGFTVHEIGGGYLERMKEAVEIVNENLGGYRPAKEFNRKD
ncbi:MAG: AAA family ATPase, partial [Erysipelotrichaceae bacterium]|nr:AAA family ATPase [Erysipelotrichaceae bacterium]